MFVDQVKVFAQAGKGGGGAVAFHREAFVPKGGPSGGNGGRGGDVILQADHDLNNLIDQYYVPRLIAKSGVPGKGKGMDGHAGKNRVVRVPCGTVVWRYLHPSALVSQEPKANEAVPGAVMRTRPDGVAMEIDLEKEVPLVVDHDEAREFVTDLTEHGQKFVLCRGGRGGLGNRHFATSTNQAPRMAQPGQLGELGEFLLELRLMADVGFVGFPNAGKSTLLTAISRARPRIAAYPFTTRHPQIGIVEYPVDYFRLTVCDVPGLIEGAHRNVGLGHAFLRHIQRCRVLVLLLDMAGTDGRQPWDDYAQVLRELELYDPAILKRPRLVAANKMDEPAAVANLKKFKRKVVRQPVLSLAAGLDEGIEEFKLAIREAAGKAPAPATSPDPQTTTH